MVDDTEKNEVEASAEPSEPGVSAGPDTGEAAGSVPAEPPPAEAPTQEEAAATTAPEPVEDPRLVEAEARLRALSAAYRNLQEEMRAYRDRVARLEEEKDRRRRGEAVVAVFEPVQNLRRSIDAIRRSQAEEAIQQGLDLVLGQFNEALRKLGLEEISAAGAAFDPTIHEAMGTVMVADPAMDGKVVHVFDTGYRIGNQVIQPARVIIGQYREPVESQA